ncbi:hypothetical protein DPMN_193529 [Dreissena polymorpha]|uniref:Uncharacterized protein n=1 Tax=Dreissena polymorpha TaxID=45954 RepID=A0A9D3Y0F5_DREPO|nr:hypothetical protein DPMN_193529 [Dreissena polymorpha]
MEQTSFRTFPGPARTPSKGTNIIQNNSRPSKNSPRTLPESCYAEVYQKLVTRRMKF